MTVQLFSNLSYAEQNARLDAMRKVLICPDPACTNRERWAGVVAATIAGWNFEDRIINGQLVRYWYCRDHRPMDPMPLKPLEPPRFIFNPDRTKLALKSGEKFDGREVVLLRYGAGNGTQIAVVLKVYGAFDARVDVTSWRATSGEWTNRKTIDETAVIGMPKPKDRRITQAAKTWPPPWMKNRRK